MKVLRLLLKGAIFGVGAAITFSVALVIFLQFVFPTVMNSSDGFLPETTGKPFLAREDKFYGTTGITDARFKASDSPVLSEGPGQIVGKAFVDGLPLSGLKVRLALNGRVFSRWVQTDENGEYSISVPFGDYRIDGFRLDWENVNKLLPGKIHKPSVGSRSGVLAYVSENKPGHGLSFNFVEPVQTIWAKREFAPEDNIVINWKAYPEASLYALQVYEKDTPHGFNGNNTFFDWLERPSVSGTSWSFSENSIQLRSGHFYTVKVQALDESGSVLSETPSVHSGYDFELEEAK